MQRRRGQSQVSKSGHRRRLMARTAAHTGWRGKLIDARTQDGFWAFVFTTFLPFIEYWPPCYIGRAIKDLHDPFEQTLAPPFKERFEAAQVGHHAVQHVP
jgi:hypothetical protein